ncbi:hypothetical protein CEXT_658031 [Caerostris extrusa]|uniref:Uncharacterized protein n=1 Tax=Caerostris extrusa TaxID=172846 RepID=A0AAV4NMJ6_CAEEX|nr:hypothetical protein CEXT_658031 [Caerostris extrusa]
MPNPFPPPYPYPSVLGNKEIADQDFYSIFMSELPSLLRMHPDVSGRLNVIADLMEREMNSFSICHALRPLRHVADFFFFFCLGLERKKIEEAFISFRRSGK